MKLRPTWTLRGEYPDDPVLRGIHTHCRGPRAHRAHVGSDEARVDFLDSLALVADVHRPLDGAVLTSRSTHRYRCKPRADRC
jgi:hypothetical protein